jgi:hypothetical protein
LEHFIFPEVFTIRAKNAHFSVVFEKTSNITETSKPQSFNSIRLALRRQNLKMKISISRKIFANFFWNEVIESELIDLLQVGFLNPYLLNVITGSTHQNSILLERSWRNYVNLSQLINGISDVYSQLLWFPFSYAVEVGP